MVEPGLINKSHFLIPGRHIQLVQTIGQGKNISQEFCVSSYPSLLLTVIKCEVNSQHC